MLPKDKKITFLGKKRDNNINLNEEKEKLKINKVGLWEEEENQILSDWVKENGPTKWEKCAQLLKSRTGKQCREHWKNFLDNKLKKGNWTSEEDILIIKLYSKYQSWRKIIPVFEGRSENSIKNRFFSQLRKFANKKKDNEKIIKHKFDKLKPYIEEITKDAEAHYFNENKNITKENFKKYMEKIEEEIDKQENNKHGNIKFIDLKSLKKSISNKNINDNDFTIKNNFIKNKDNNINKEKNSTKDNNYINNNKSENINKEQIINKSSDNINNSQKNIKQNWKIINNLSKVKKITNKLKQKTNQKELNSSMSSGNYEEEDENLNNIRLVSKTDHGKEIQNSNTADLDKFMKGDKIIPFHTKSINISQFPFSISGLFKYSNI